MVAMPTVFLSSVSVCTPLKLVDSPQPTPLAVPIEGLRVRSREREEEEQKFHNRVEGEAEGTK